MKSLSRQPASRWLNGTAAVLATFAASDRLRAIPFSDTSAGSTAQPDAHGRFGFSYDRVLGTSLDVRLDAASARDAREGERQILAEIDRLEKILSIYNPASEISRVKTGGAVESPELADVLAAYELWSARTGGALSSNLAEVISLWKQAAATGRPPDDSALAAALAQPRALNIDALGKGYVIDRAVEVARRFAPAGLLNLGGDLRVWGDRPCMVGIANPRDAADNAAPLLRFPLRDAAVATSAGYARYYEIGGKRYSHLIDPRTLRPIDAGMSATVVARDGVTANALSTAAAVLGAEPGATLARTYGVDHLIASAATSSTQERIAVAADSSVPALVSGTWPTGFQVAVTVALKSPDGSRFKRPYVAVWVEGHDQKVIRTLTIWGKQGRYLPELTKWWHATGGDHSIIQSVSRATRQPGAYTLAWDGLDENGHAVPTGEYKIWVEINREHGHHVFESVAVRCGTEPVTAELRATAETNTASIEYGPKTK